jgi:uncharacterized protein (DUF362 family)
LHERWLKGKVVMVKSTIHENAGHGDMMEAVAGQINSALESLLGGRGRDAWRAVFDEDERVVIKVNALGGRAIATRPWVAEGLARCLVNAGIPPSRILIWDRSTQELQRAGYRIRKRGSGPLCFGTDLVGYERLPRLYGRIGSCFSRILTKWATALVDVPVLKDHDLAGVSIGIKNLFGVIHNPNKYHDEGCAPYLADLLASPPVEGKLRLVVCDAQRAQCHGGPSYSPRWNWPLGRLMVAVDPVALDAVGVRIIEERRKEMGLPALAEEGRPPRHVREAHLRGLGEGRPEAIDVVELG